MALQREISRTPMPKNDAGKIQRHFTYLEDNIDAAYLVSHIFKDGIIDHEEMLRIESQPNKKSRNKALLTTLLDSGEYAWGSFITALRESGFKQVANELHQKEEKCCDNDAADSNASYVTSYLDTERENTSSLSVITNHKEEVHEKEILLTEKVLSLEAQVDDLLKENSQLREDLQGKDHRIEGQKQEIDGLREELGPLKAEILKLRSEKLNQHQHVQALEAKIAEMDGKLSNLNTKIEALQQKENKSKSKVCRVS